MFKKLQRQFVLIVMAVAAILLTLVFSGIYYFMSQNAEKESTMFMERKLYEDKTPFPVPIPPDRPIPDMRHVGYSFLVELNRDGSVEAVTSDFRAPPSSEFIAEIIALTGSEDRGILRSSQGEFRYWRIGRPAGFRIVYLDRQQEIETLKALIRISVAFGFGCGALLLIVSVFLSSWILKPVKSAWEKQKQFVEDASHELRTPLSVLNANLDVVLSNPKETVHSQHKWLAYIKTESERMSRLVGDLLYLAKADNSRRSEGFFEFDLSEAVMSVALPFETVACENQIRIESVVPENIKFIGDEGKIKQLVSILLDNAVKYTSPGGDIIIELAVSGDRKKMCLTVNNTGEPIPDASLKKIFERFYRVDPSRARATGGVGLGLSIAQKIVELHSGAIAARNIENGKTEFRVELPVKHRAARS